MNNDMLISYLRTGVPAAWGLFITWLMSQLGWLAGFFEAIGVDPTSKQTGAVITSIFFFVWYAVWRWVEKKWGASLPPILFKLVLGSSQTPEYSQPRHAAGIRPVNEAGRISPYWLVVITIVLVIVAYFLFVHN